MIILSISDKVEGILFDVKTHQRFADVDLVLGCGDLPYYYLEFLVDSLNIPVMFVRGNHDAVVEYSENGDRTEPNGAINLHHRVIRHQGLIIAGIEGSMRYRAGPHQYTQAQMWWMVLTMMPALLWNRLVHHRWLDILISHSPPWGINDQPDRAHRGFKALRWLLEVCKPAYHFHGHVHVNSSTKKVETRYAQTAVVNTYGYHKTMVDVEVIISREKKESNNGK